MIVIGGAPPVSRKLGEDGGCVSRGAGAPQGHRLNCAVCDRTGSSLVLRRGDRGGGTSARFSTRRTQGGRRGPRSRLQIALRAKRFEPYSVALVVLPCFLRVENSSWVADGTCSPVVGSTTANSSDCPGAPRALRSCASAGGACWWRESVRLAACVPRTIALGRRAMLPWCAASMPMRERSSARRASVDAFVDTKGAGRARVVLACLAPLAVCG